ncbi:MAG: AbrB/MazE/SpoVT family DNA-binding domain-containing protein [Candidatus Korarchaeota archaeon NZ13-K]|nr:MAG: AbrB/MazE/SpoVT family DNA-binding domain-containing protein [Candidatus Korarchaeota archaeon NZ13-K]
MPYVKLRVKRWRMEEREYMSYQITAPKRLIERLGWKVGDMLQVRVREGELVYSRVDRRPLSNHLEQETLQV